MSNHCNFRDTELSNIKTELQRTGEAKLYEHYNSADELMALLSAELKANFMAVSICVIKKRQILKCSFKNKILKYVM